MKRRPVDLTPRVYLWLDRPAGSEAPRYRWFVGSVYGDAQTRERALEDAEAWLAAEREREEARRAAAAARSDAAKARRRPDAPAHA